MKKIVFIVTFIVVAALSFAGGVIRATTTNVNMRVSANSSSRIILTIPIGTPVYLAEDCDCTWVFVSYQGYCGYVCARYLTASVPAATASAVAQEPVRYYTNSYGNTVQRPTHYNTTPQGATALCRDGSYSFSQHRKGTCSGHGGVARWL